MPACNHAQFTAECTECVAAVPAPVVPPLSVGDLAAASDQRQRANMRAAVRALVSAVEIVDEIDDYAVVGGIRREPSCLICGVRAPAVGWPPHHTECVVRAARRAFDIEGPLRADYPAIPAEVSALVCADAPARPRKSDRPAKHTYWLGWVVPGFIPASFACEVWPVGIMGWLTGTFDDERGTHETWVGVVDAASRMDAWRRLTDCYGPAREEIRERWEPKPMRLGYRPPSDRFPWPGEG